MPFVLFVPFVALFWEGGFFGDAFCLLEMAVFVYDDDPVRVHQAVSDRAKSGRGDNDLLEVEMFSRFHLFDDPSLLFDEVVNH